MTSLTFAIDDLFADPNLACDAIYNAGGSGPNIAVRVIFADTDEKDSFAVTAAIVRNCRADVRLSQIASPARGDTIKIGDLHYTVKASPQLDRMAGIARLSLAED